MKKTKLFNSTSNVDDKLKEKELKEKQKKEKKEQKEKEKKEKKDKKDKKEKKEKKDSLKSSSKLPQQEPEASGGSATPLSTVTPSNSSRPSFAETPSSSPPPPMSLAMFTSSLSPTSSGNILLIETKQYLHTLCRFVPLSVIQDSSLWKDVGPDQVVSSNYESVILFADISGFSALAHKLSLRDDGTELLTNLINGFLGELINIILFYEGDVIKFAGDAIFVTWRVPSFPSATRAAQIKQCLLKPIQCAVDIQRKIKDYHMVDPKERTPIHLRVRISIADGDLLGMHVGLIDHKEYVIAGNALNEVIHLDTFCNPGEICISKAVWEKIKETSFLTAVSILDKVVKILWQTGWVKGKEKTSLFLQDTLTSPVDVSLIPFLERYVPHFILERLKSGQNEFLAETRVVSILFIALDSFDYSTNGMKLLHETFSYIESEIFKHEGHIRQLICDDKGTVVIGAFGLPQHEDDPSRAVFSALHIASKFSVSIGVTTGKVLCGTVGNQQRCEFALIGNPVNLSARLMGKAKGRVLCDATTRSLARLNFSFKELVPVELKGFSEPVPIFLPSKKLRKARSDSFDSSIIIGRSEELNILTEALQQILDKKAPIIIVEGEPGIGKTTLLQNFRISSVSFPGYMFASSITSMSGEESSSYSLFSDLLIQILATVNIKSPMKRILLKTLSMPSLVNQKKTNEDSVLTTSLLLFFEDAPNDLQPYLPLLNVVLPSLELPHNTSTRNVFGELQALYIIKLLSWIFEKLLQSKPLILIIENIQWIDSASARVLSIISQMPSLLLICSTRVIEYSENPFLSQVDPVSFTKIKLQPLSQDSILRIALSCIESEKDNIEIVEEEVLEEEDEEFNQLLMNVTQGNPLYVVELIYSLISTNSLVLKKNKKPILRSNSKRGLDISSKSTNSFATLQRIITSRIDKLSATQQLLIRMASVIGVKVEKEILTSIYPGQLDEELLEYDYNTLEELQLIDNHPQYFDFKSAIVQQVVYNSLLKAQKISLHKKVAFWFEDRFKIQEAGHYYPILGYHYHQAGLVKEAVHYYMKAGEYSCKTYSSKEAITFLSLCLDINSKSEEQNLTSLEFGFVNRLLYEAFFMQGKLPSALEKLELTFKYLSFQVDLNTLNIQSIISTFLEQEKSLTSFQTLESPNMSRESELAKALTYKGEISYFVGALIDTLFYSCESLLFALRSHSPSYIVCKAYIMVAMALSVCGVTELVPVYLEKAQNLFQHHSTNLHQDPMSLLMYHLATYVPLYYQGQYKLVLSEIEEMKSIAEKLGNKRRITMALSGSSLPRFFFNTNLETCYSLSYQSYLMADRKEVSDIQYRISSRLIAALVKLVLGEEQVTTKIILEVEKLMNPRILPRYWVMYHSLKAFYFCQMKQWEEILKHYIESGKVIGQYHNLLNVKNCTVNRTVQAIYHIALLVEEFGSLVEHFPNASEVQTSIPTQLQFAVEDASYCSSMMKVYELYFLGSLHCYLKKNLDVALDYWKKSLDQANHFEMTWTKARLHLELSKHKHSEIDQIHHATEAKELFTKMGAILLVPQCIQPNSN